MTNEFDNPKRWQPIIRHGEPSGSYKGGISNPYMTALFAAVVTHWVFLEERMIEVLDWLLFTYEERGVMRKRSRGHTPARQIFRSVGTHNYRVKLMKNLLSNFIGNIKRDKIYDEIIEEFGAIGALRNNYVHGLWYTHEKGGTYIKTQNVHEFAAMRKVETKEIEGLLKRMDALTKKVSEIVKFEIPEMADKKS